MILVKSRRLDWAYVLGLATILLGAELIVLHSGTKKSWSTGLTASLWLLPIGILLAVLVGVEPSTNRLYWRFGRRVRQARASIDPYSLGHMYPWLDGRDQRSAPSETDRAQSQEVLKAALSHGYLSGDAYQDQLSRIRSAATLADLRSVLPALPVSAQTPVYPSRAMRRVAWDWRIAGIVVGTFMAMFLLALLSA